jgi:hypothetical protein
VAPVREYILNAWHERFGTCAVGSHSAVAVEAVDARSGRPLPLDIADRTTVIVSDGAYADTSASGLYGGVGSDRMGTYEVVVRAPGYREWRATGVRPARRVCYIQTAVLRARLEPV